MGDPLLAYFNAMRLTLNHRSVPDCLVGRVHEFKLSIGALKLFLCFQAGVVQITVGAVRRDQAWLLVSVLVLAHSAGLDGLRPPVGLTIFPIRYPTAWLDY